MFATNLLVSTQNRLQMTIRVIVLVETFASTWMYKQYYIYHWPRPLGPSSDPNYEALSLVMTRAARNLADALRSAQFVEMGRADLHSDSRIRRIPFAVARRFACADRDGGAGVAEFPAQNAIAGWLRRCSALHVCDCSRSNDRANQADSNCRERRRPAPKSRREPASSWRKRGSA